MSMMAKRLQKLEQTNGGGKRMIVCTVRNGHKDEDLARVLADAGVFPGRNDLVVVVNALVNEARRLSYSTSRRAREITSLLLIVHLVQSIGMPPGARRSPAEALAEVAARVVAKSS
jgi:hypothetical protein